MNSKIASLKPMIIDVATIVTALGGAAVLAAGCGLIFLKLFERTLDHRFRALEERSKIELDAHHKRTLALFEKQIAPLKAIIALSYRSRNLAREISQKIVQVHLVDSDSLKKLHVYHDALVEMILEERAIIPDQSFIALHELKGSIHSFIAILQLAQRSKDFDRRDANYNLGSAKEHRVALAENAQSNYERLSSLYEYVATHIQEYLGATLEATSKSE